MKIHKIIIIIMHASRIIKIEVMSTARLIISAYRKNLI
jgi:hypothetical protein